MSFNCFIILKCSKLVILLNCLFYLSTNLILNFMHDITWNDLIYKLVCRGWFCMKYYVIVSRCWLFHRQYFNTRSNSSEAETSFKSNVYCFKAGKKKMKQRSKMFDTDEKVSNYENKTEISVIMFLKYEIKINV